ncbi:hypothetical protein NC653_028663 [Populus alba x Populus x berolinensis]|uniref:Uncharacterized protein n=1 Tax=Populus alba x Populus x berolinensis TaxID=444605 RepID=A0AAD6M0I0_9ROSI|nr:hypothetical protein NC653_028663 [Populus alba x Populus x berolinensis]
MGYEQQQHHLQESISLYKDFKVAHDAISQQSIFTPFSIREKGSELRLNWSLLQHINHGFSFLSSLFHRVSSLESCMLWNGCFTYWHFLIRIPCRLFRQKSNHNLSQLMQFVENMRSKVKKLQKTLENLWCNDSFKIVLRGDKHSKVLAITESKRKRSRKCIPMNPKIRDCAGR